jgi:hypothetical protein
LFHFFLLFYNLELRWRGGDLTVESAKSGKVRRGGSLSCLTWKALEFAKLLWRQTLLSFEFQSLLPNGWHISQIFTKVFWKVPSGGLPLFESFVYTRDTVCVNQQQDGTTFCCLLKILTNSKGFDVQQSDIMKGEF